MEYVVTEEGSILTLPIMLQNVICAAAAGAEQEEKAREHEAWKIAERKRDLYQRIGINNCPGMTLDGYDPSRWAKGFEIAAKLANKDNRENCLFIGPTNVGKTHLLRAIGKARIDLDPFTSIEYLNEGRLFNTWKEGFSDVYIERHVRALINRAKHCALLIWDELGRVFSAGDNQGAELRGISLLFEEIIDSRAEQKKQTIFASMFSDLATLQAKLGAAIFRRVMRQEKDTTNCVIVNYKKAVK